MILFKNQNAFDIIKHLLLFSQAEPHLGGIQNTLSFNNLCVFIRLFRRLHLISLEG